MTVVPSEATRDAAEALGSLDVGTALIEDADDTTAVANALDISATGDNEWKDEPLEQDLDELILGFHTYVGPWSPHRT